MHEAPVQDTIEFGLGERLRLAREKAGTTLADAAAKLRCDLRVLEALEGERFTELGAAVYARGHLRRYAELLGEPFEPLEALFAAHEASSVRPDLTQAPRITDWRPPRVRGPRRSRRWTRWMLAFVVLLAVLGLSWWVFIAPAMP
jgi:cytoskeletal protein RodZ